MVRFICGDDPATVWEGERVEAGSSGFGVVSYWVPNREDHSYIFLVTDGDGIFEEVK